MKSVGRELKLEIRRSLIQTLENIIKNHGASLSDETWMRLLKDFLMVLLNHASRVYSGISGDDI